MTKIAGLYDMEATLGSGHFAVVKSARHVFTGQRVAVKIIDKAKLDDISKAHLYQEVRCMKLVTHPSIIRLYEVIDTQSKLYLIQELGDGGDLYEFIMKHPSGVDEEITRTIFRQTVSAIQYCHKLHVVHRDLKPENLVFVTPKGHSGTTRVKLTDFGLSRTFLPGEMIESACGSLEYSAPEILLGDSYDPPKVDVWSLGVILFMLLSGHSPFASGGTSETLTHIMDGKYSMPTHISELCKSLISTMLVVDAEHRVSLAMVASHLWIREGQEKDAILPPSISTIAEIPEIETELILHRMDQGGYGSPEDVLMSIHETPYGSTAATFFLLAEAERHRKMSRSSAQPSTPNRARKMSVPAMSPSHAQNRHFTFITPSPLKSHGSAETGILTRRVPLGPSTPRSRHTPDVSTPLRRGSEITPPYSTLTSPYSYSSPQTGGGASVSVGVQNHWTSPKPSFPLQIASLTPSTTQDDAILEEDMTENGGEEGGGENQIVLQTPPTSQRSPNSLTFRPTRQLSTFEEESESESLSDIMSSRAASLSPHGSPLRSPRSRRLLNARSSPNICSTSLLSKSDHSDEEEDEDDDDIVELMTSSGRFPKAGATFPRMSPSSSPLLTSRRSPTHNWTGSSDEEVASIFESARKHRNKRLPYRRRSASKLSRVDSVSSDDGTQNESGRHRVSNRRQKLLRMRQYNSLPATPADTSTSDSLTEILENMRRQRSGSNRTDSSMSDGGRSEKELNDLANSLVTRFDLSDEDAERCFDGSMDFEGEGRSRTGSGRSHTGSGRSQTGSGSVRTYSVVCCIL